MLAALIEAAGRKLDFGDLISSMCSRRTVTLRGLCTRL